MRSWLQWAVLLCALCAWRVDAALPALVIEGDATSFGTTNNGELIEDPTGTLTITQIHALPHSNFHSLSTLKRINPGHAYWVRVHVQNGLATDTTLIVSATWWDFIDCYVERQNGVLETLRQTGLRGAAKSSEQSFYAKFNLLRNEDAVLYARLSSTGKFRLPTSINVLLRPALSTLEHEQYGLYFDGILFGILFGLAIYNIFIAASLRDRSTFWYCVYLLFVSISFMGQMGEFASKITQFILPDSPVVSLWIKRLADPLGWISLIMFSKLFLSVQQTLPRLNIVLNALIFIQVGLAIASALVPNETPINLVFFQIVSLTIIAAGITRWRMGFRQARFFIAAHAILLLTSMPNIFLLFGVDILPFMPEVGFLRFIKDNFVFTGFAIEALLFSFALAQRMRALQDDVSSKALAFEAEKKQIAEQQREHLEHEVTDRTKELKQERDKADELLYNILPAMAADELKATGHCQPRRFEDATILFTDFKGFTNAVSTLPPKKVVAELDDIFHHFDEIIRDCGVEKIKTIGDAYMIAGGLPLEQPDHAVRCTEAALRMMEYIETRNLTSALKWQMRAGMHSGTVVAGVVGKHKFTYDVWGDTVNIASRMESASEVGRINVSAYTFDLIKHRFNGHYRGKLDAKGKGEVDMYFVDASSPSQVQS